MKGALIGILFGLLSVLFGTGGMGHVPTDGATDGVCVEMARSEAGEMNRLEDKMLHVLAEANRYADVSVRTSGTGIGQVARRYRTTGSGWDKLTERQPEMRRAELHAMYKTTEVLSKECAARLKSAGYYIYTLRKILI